MYSSRNFAEKLNIINPSIKLLSEYIKTSERVECKCLVCENIWTALPSNLLSGYGCPKCAMAMRQKTRLEKNGNLRENYPSLAEEWHPIKNGALTPEDVTIGSVKKVWWYLPYDDPFTGKHFDFEWQASIVNRVAGQGCPYLSGKKILVGYNDLATTHPKLAREWHPVKNGDLTPWDISKGSSKKVWWLLRYDNPSNGKHFDFEWQASVSARVAGSGCPYLSGHKLYEGFNDLLSTNPDLASEWHPSKNGELKPNEISATSRKKVWWKCHKGHEWVASVSHRLHGSGCPMCSSEQRTSFYEYAILYYVSMCDPMVIHSYQGFGFELDIYIPELHVGIEYDGEYWHKRKQNADCEKNNSCKKLGITLYRFRENTLGSLNSTSIDIACTKATFGQCLQGLLFELFNVYINVDIDKDFYDISKHRIFTEKKESLLDLYPELAKEWHPTKNGNIRPEHVRPMSNVKAWWLLPYDDESTGAHFDFEWQAEISTRVKGAGCPFITEGSTQVWTGFNDLETKYPDIAKEWHPTKNGSLSPSKVTVKSSQKVWWLLSYDDEATGKHFDFEWKARVSDRTNGQECPYLSGKMIMKGFNDLATTHPELAKEWHPTRNGNLTPDLVTHGNKLKVWWLLPYDDKNTGKHFDFEWQASILDRSRGRGCPYLAGKAIWEGYNDFASLYPSIAKEWHPIRNENLLPNQITVGSKRKVWWKCYHCGGEWKTSVYERIKRGKGCPLCYK